MWTDLRQEHKRARFPTLLDTPEPLAAHRPPNANMSDDNADSTYTYAENHFQFVITFLRNGAVHVPVQTGFDM